MTAAVTLLALAVIVLSISAVAFGGLYASKSSDYADLKATNGLLIVDNRGLTSQNVAKATRIASLELELKETQGQRDRYRAASLSGLPDDLVRDIVNGVPADKDRREGSPDRESSGAAGTVSDL